MKEWRDADGAALGDIRVLDLAGHMGAYCTKLLADLGADVIKVEEPAGDPVRGFGPFYRDVPDKDKSLLFFQLNTNKRSITLDLHKDEGREVFAKLAADADVVVETFQPGYLDRLGLGYEVLKAINPKLILTSITGFGQDGPYSQYKASDMIGAAMGGFMYITGFPEDAPTLPGASQAYHLASVNAAAGTLMALYARGIAGEGQHVDVSMQEAVGTCISTVTTGTYDLTKYVYRREGRPHQSPLVSVLPCKDGYVVIATLREGDFDIFVEWMNEEGMAGDLTDEKWRDEAFRRSQRAHADEIVARFLLTHTQEELFQEAVKRRSRGLMPVYTTEDLLREPQLVEREFYVLVDHPELGETLKYPGAPYRLSLTPWRIARRPPLLGEHNAEVYLSVGLSEQELGALRQKGVI